MSGEYVVMWCVSGMTEGVKIEVLEDFRRQMNVIEDWLPACQASPKNELGQVTWTDEEGRELWRRTQCLDDGDNDGEVKDMCLGRRITRVGRVDEMKSAPQMRD